MSSFKKIVLPGFVAGVAMVVVGFCLNFIMDLIWPILRTIYTNSPVFRPWDDPLMFLFFVAPFIIAIGLAWIWDKTKKLWKYKVPWQNGAMLGFLYWLFASVPGLIISYSSFQVSFLMTFTWLAFGLAQYVIGGVVIVKMGDRK